MLRTVFPIKLLSNLLSITIFFCLIGQQASANTQYHYDSNGQLEAVALPSGEMINMQYDANGNLLKIDNPASVPSKYFNGADQIVIGNVEADEAPGGKNTVSFWMYWDGTENALPITWGNQAYALWMNGGSFGFNTGQANILGIPSASLKQKWIHVAAVFYNGTPTVTENELYINGVKQSIDVMVGGTFDARKAGNSLVEFHV